MMQHVSATGKSVVLAHPYALIRKGIAHILREAGFEVIGQTDTALGLRWLFPRLQPDIIVLDWELAGLDAAFLRGLADSNPKAAIVILTRPHPVESALPLIQAGASGCLSVDISEQEFVEALKYDNPEKQLQFHTRTPGGPGERAAIFHGHGVGIDDAKDNLLRYFDQVDKGLREVLRDEQAPLVLAGVDYLFPVYKEANTYSHLMDEGVGGNPEEKSAEELHGEVWAIVEPRFQKEQQAALAQYEELVGTGHTSRDIREIAPAAYQGRVATLFVATGIQQWGAFDPEANRVELHEEPRPNDEDLLDLAAIQTFLNKGTVYAVEPERVPENAPLVAIFRY